MSGRLLPEPFIAFQPSLVREFGSLEAALILQYVAYRQADPETYAPIPIREFCEASALSESTVKRQTRALIEAGALIRRQSPGLVAEYAVDRSHPALGGSPGPGGEVSGTPVDCSSLEDQEQPSPQSGEEGVVIDLFGAPAPVAEEPPPGEDEWTPEAKTQACRQAWFEGYGETHPGRPDPTVTRRTLGAIKAAARDRTDDDDWRRLWSACRAAGRVGRYDVVNFIDGGPVQRFGRRNMYATQARQMVEAQRSSPASVLGSMMDNRPAVTRGT